MGGGSLGNFVADALRAMGEKRLGSPVALAVVNTSGLRKNWITAGALSATDIYELLPFENALVALDLTGEQLLRFMRVNVERRNAQSGARIVYHNNPEKKRNEMVSLKLLTTGAEREVDPEATYTIVTIDYLVKRGGEYSILQEGKNLRPLRVTMRDAMLEYIKGETAAGRVIKANLDGRFKSDGINARPEDEQR
jgi:2',3'-cyclic-nucleotide 2'-phosphodiesterase (5'-nucleotidase family)